MKHVTIFGKDVVELKGPPETWVKQLIDHDAMRARNWGLVCGFGYGFAADHDRLHNPAVCNSPIGGHVNLYSIKPHDKDELYYATGNSFGQAVRKYKTRRKSSKDLNLADWKDVPEPSKVVLVCQKDLLLAGRE